MLAPLILLIFYYSLFLFLFYWLSKTGRISLSFQQASLIFTLKFLFGCLYGLLFLKLYNGDDTWKSHYESLTEYSKLKSNPLTFFTEIFHNGYAKSQALTFFDSNKSYWKNLPENLLFKLLAIFNLFSNSNYYVNVLFFNLITLCGHYFLYKIFLRFFPLKQAIVFTLVFFFPSLIFWESGIRKDGISFTALTGCLYYLLQYTYERKKVISLAKALFFFILLFLFKNFIALSLIPPFIALSIAVKYQKKTGITFATTLIASLVLFFSTSLGPAQLNLPQKMAERQNAFLQLEGGSYMPIPALQGRIQSYLAVFPIAINHSLLRPYITEARNPLNIFAALENILVIGIILLSFYRFRSLKAIISQPGIALLLSIACINYLIVGYTVPFAGAVIRYRAMFDILLLVPLLIAIDKNEWITKPLNKVYNYLV